jgi:hypothetical protein
MTTMMISSVFVSMIEGSAMSRDAPEECFRRSRRHRQHGE